MSAFHPILSDCLCDLCTVHPFPNPPPPIPLPFNPSSAELSVTDRTVSTSTNKMWSKISMKAKVLFYRLFSFLRY